MASFIDLQPLVSWDIFDENTGAVSFVKDSADTGHFTAAPASGVKQDCLIKVNDTILYIDAITNDGTGSSNFTSSLTSLSPETLYYIRAYATNTPGTA